jgi:pimeloyl-ACP methyl ester carboxylesterase
MGRALALRGVLAILAEGPGQGLSRLRGGMHLDETTLPLLSAFLDHVETLGARHLGVWGNSFGGLFSAHLAAQDTRVQALCINGAPMVPVVPSFRTAREQGGRDALVPLGEQESFFTLTPTPTEAPLTWRNGEHTIYNYSQERNARISDWFVEMLT